MDVQIVVVSLLEEILLPVEGIEDPFPQGVDEIVDKFLRGCEDPVLIMKFHGEGLNERIYPLLIRFRVIVCRHSDDSGQTAESVIVAEVLGIDGPFLMH